MKRRTVNLLLALSLLFNAFVLVGYLRYLVGDDQALAADEVVDRAVEDLNLNEEQRKAFTDLRASMEEDKATYDDAIALAKQELDEEMRSESPDRQRLDEINERLADLYHQRRIAGARRFGEFVEALSPEQRRRMSERMHRGRRGEGPRRGGPPQHFDRNRDGVLDEQERAELRKATSPERGRRDGWSRRGRNGQTKRQIYDRFDADRDGQLDEAELAEVLKWLAEPPGRRDAPNGPPPPEREPPPPRGEQRPL
jgi:Spy/CpxP family protein refolding chaperone